MRRLILPFAFVLALHTIVTAQAVQVSKTNKTIAVTAQDTIEVEPDVAVVKVGYHNYALTQKDAYDENVGASDRILKAFIAAGVNKSSIATGTIKVQRIDPEKEWTPEQRKNRQFEAQQTWEIRVAAKDAQRLVDLAMRSGANDLEELTWEFADRAALQAKAGGAALAKARSIADQMAKGLGAKLGDLVYASNFAPSLFRGTFDTQAVVVSAGMAGDGGGRDRDQLQLTLFPEKVKQDATVHAVFSIE